MSYTRIYLARHGQVEGHECQRYNGQGNVPLTALGRAQSERICRHLDTLPIGAVYSSDLDRSSHCARLVAERHGLNVFCEAALREIHIGDWEGRTWDELQEGCPDAWQERLDDLANYQVPGGESLQQAADRVRPVIRQILQRHVGETVVVVAHGGINRIVLLDAIGADLKRAFNIEQDYGCLNIIDYLDRGHAVVKLLNGMAHQNENRHDREKIARLAL